MKNPVFLLLLPLLLAVSAFADDQLRSVQNALKTQGFFYGEVSGQASPETTAAIRRYQIRNGLEVTGTVIPSLSTAGQPSVGETAELIKEIERQNVSAIFAESSVNAKVEQAIAREAGAKVGRALWADTLGPSGSDGATYLQSLASNTRAIVDGVTEGQASCSLPS